MNDLMSAGLHRCGSASPSTQRGARERVLDVAGGTGDLARLFADGRRRAAKSCQRHQRGDARRGTRPLLDRGLPLPAVSATPRRCRSPTDFDASAIAFGLRNVTDKEPRSPRCAACSGRAARRRCSSFPRLPPLEPVYDWYSFKVLPRLGRRRQRRESYRYLAESIRKHPDQATLKKR